MPAPGVLGNDIDVDHNALVAQLVGDVAFGRLVLEGDGSFTYEPDSGFDGTDHFQYRVFDGTLTSPAVDVTIEVRDVSNNHPPVALPDAYWTPRATVLNWPDPGVLANDADPDGDTLAAELVASPLKGTIAFRNEGGFVYTPGEGALGIDSFSYRVSDGITAFGPVEITIEIRNVDENTAPTAISDSVSATSGVRFEQASPGVLTNDVDPERDALIAVLQSQPGHGVLELDEQGGFSYTPNTGYVGLDQFTYCASDGNALSQPVSVQIDVARANAAPGVLDDDYSITSDGTLTITAPGVLGNDADPNSDPLTSELVLTTLHGELALQADGSFVYQPDPGYSGSDEFVYRADDGELQSEAAIVTLRVGEVVFSDGFEQ